MIHHQTLWFFTNHTWDYLGISCDTGYVPLRMFIIILIILILILIATFPKPMTRLADPPGPMKASSWSTSGSRGAGQDGHCHKLVDGHILPLIMLHPFGCWLFAAVKSAATKCKLDNKWFAWDVGSWGFTMFYQRNLWAATQISRKWMCIYLEALIECHLQEARSSSYPTCQKDSTRMSWCGGFLICESMRRKQNTSNTFLNYAERWSLGSGHFNISVRHTV